MKLFTLALIYASPFVWAADFVAPSEIQLEAVYQLSLLNPTTSQTRSVPLKFEEYSTLELLLRETAPVAFETLNPSVVDHLNQKSAEAVGRAIIERLETGYSLHRPPVPVSETLFDINRPDQLFVYRGYAVDLTDKQRLFVKAIASTPSQLASYTDLARAMGWTTSTPAVRAADYLSEINRRTLQATGARLFSLVRGIGVRLNKPTWPRLLTEGNVTTDAGTLRLNGPARRVFEVLHLARLPYPSRLIMSQRDFEEVGLPQREFLRALISLNREFEKIYVSPLISAVQMTLVSRQQRFTLLPTSYRATQLGFAWLEPINCESSLTAPIPPGALNWRVIPSEP